jgi:hypothetical protein
LEVVVEGLEGDTVYLAYHYGDLQRFYDTTVLDAKAYGVFQGEETLPGGMYLVVFPGQKNYFEFLVDHDQEFSLTTTEANPAIDMVVKGSDENELFFEDLRFIQAQKTRYGELEKNYKRLKALCDSSSSVSKCDSFKLAEAELMGISKEVESRRAQFMADHPDLLYTYILKASENPVIPEELQKDTSDLGQNRRYYYYKAHYWDAIDFTDDRILRTAVYHQKLKSYIETLVMQHPDSIIVDADVLIARTRANKELFKYTTAWILNKYAENKFVCMDKIYVHIAENYYLTGDADWVGKEQLDRIRRDAASMKPCICGAIGADIKAMDLNGQMKSLYDIKTDFTILMFVESDCGHCQKELPKVYNYWLSAREQSVGAMVLATDLLVDGWKKYFNEKGYTEWVAVVDPEETSGYKWKYNVSSTPIIYVLDKEKRIVGKRLSADNLPGYMEFLLKQKSKS